MSSPQSVFAISKQFRSLGEFFSGPAISALCQFNAISAGIATYIGGSYTQEQFKTLERYMKLLDEKVKYIDEKYIDKEFINSPEGQRLIGKVFRGILNDNRQEKLEAMANLTLKVYTIYTYSKLSYDEKELYIGLLDSLNSLQLSILQKATTEMQGRKVKHRGFGWEIFAQHYKQRGISKALLLQSISVLESNGLVNKNTGTVSEADKTHFVTDFGEQFYGFISSIPRGDGGLTD